MTSSIRFYTEKLGFSVEFNCQDFYTAIRAGKQEIDDLAAFAARLKASGVPLAEDVHETPWNTREIVIHDDQGHTLVSWRAAVAADNRSSRSRFADRLSQA